MKPESAIRRGVSRACGVFAGLLFVVSAVAADSASDLSGVWRGPWYLGMSSGVATLIVSDGDSGSVTLSMTNNEDFGGDPVPVHDLALSDDGLSFRSTGANGAVLVAKNLPVDRVRETIKGFVRYGGYKLRFELKRASPPR
ncbi:MAG: hypothetical protein GC151_04160 [Betaproteobacteria bacterium]|nr:hypothetical protein [Betaproteobacteria bacterium]